MGIKIKKLPIRPSKLIRTTVEDIKKVERSKRYKIDMDHWAKISSSNTCSVCMGGAALMNQVYSSKVDFKADVRKYSNFTGRSLDVHNSRDRIGEHNYRLVDSLDSLQIYSYSMFLDGVRKANWLGCEFKYIEEKLKDLESAEDELRSLLPHNFREVKYRSNPERFKENMLIIAEALEQMGL